IEDGGISDLATLGFCNLTEHRRNRGCNPYEIFDGFTNQCTLAYAMQFEDQDTDLAMKILYGILLPILVLLVIITNGVVILILRTQRISRSPVEPLFWMGISALCMAISPLPYTIYYYNLDHSSDGQHTEFLCILRKICMEELPFFFNTIITFLTLLLGIQRFIAVQFPLRSFDLCSQKMTKRAIRIAFLLTLLISCINYGSESSILLHFCLDLTSSLDLSSSSSQSVHIWVARCSSAYTPLQLWIGRDRFSSFLSTMRLALLVIPSFSLIILTILLIRSLRDSSLSQISTQSNRCLQSRKSTSKTTVMLTVIIVLFLIARLPSTSLILLNQMSESFPTVSLFRYLNSLTHSFYLLPFANLVFITLHPLTFAVYLLMSRRFREALRNFLPSFLRFSDSTCPHLNSSKTAEKVPLNNKRFGSPMCGRCVKVQLLKQNLKSERPSIEADRILARRHQEF
ncbi:sprr-3, partial [Pristionchus pacificus]